jgi:hypothetical protein
MVMSRSVWLRGHDEPDRAAHEAVACPPFAPPEPAFRPSFSEVFHEHYRPIREVLNAHPEPGLALFVASAEGLEASAWWEAAERDINPLILGRHSSTEVFIPSDPLLSLRHLAIVVRPRKEGEGVRFRVLDLRTPTAFRDEEGRRVEAVEADGPLLLRFASQTALLFPTGDGREPWPREAVAAWKKVPARTHLSCTAAEPEQWLELAGRAPGRSPESGDAPDPPTLSARFPGPDFVERDAAGEGSTRGVLMVRWGDRCVPLHLGETAMREGVLLGRCERCDDGSDASLGGEHVSRVHLLLVEMAGGFYAIDTASRNGLWCGSRDVPVARLLPGLVLALADEASVEWRPFQ